MGFAWQGDVFPKIHQGDRLRQSLRGLINLSEEHCRLSLTSSSTTQRMSGRVRRLF